MTRCDPGPDCYDLAFQAAYPLDEPAAVALEDYARTVTGARESETVRRDDDPAMVRGVHVCGLGTPLTQTVVTDIEDFARGLVVRLGTAIGRS